MGIVREIAQDTGQPDRMPTDDIAQRALGFAQQYKTPLTPAVYETWFIYVTRSVDAVNQALDLAMNMAKPITEATLTELHLAHISPRAVSEDLADMTDTLQNTMGEVSTAVESNIRDHTAFTGALRQAKKSLVHGTSKREVAEIITQLHKVNQTQISSAQRMSVQLEKNRAQVSKLERELVEVRREASTDFLTKLPNRRGLDKHMQDAAFRAREKRTSLTVALCDVDGLSRINLEYGLAAGDNVLKVFANTLVKKIRAADTAARFAGSKFALVLEGADVNAARKVATAIRETFTAIDWVSEESGDEIGKLNVSFGIAPFRADDSGDTALDRANALLDEAKASGAGAVRIG